MKSLWCVIKFLALWLLSVALLAVMVAVVLAIVILAGWLLSSLDANGGVSNCAILFLCVVAFVYLAIWSIIQTLTWFDGDWRVVWPWGDL